MGTALYSTSGLVPILFSLIGVLGALQYLKGQADFSKGISAVFFGFLCIFLLKLLIWVAPALGTYYSFLELLLRLLAAVFFITGGLEIKGIKLISRTVLLTICLVIVVWCWYVVIITNDANTYNFSLALSTVGYGIFAISLWSKKSLRNSLGFVVTGWICIFLVVYNLLAMMSWGEKLVSPSFETFLYIALMCGLILISNNLLAHQFESLSQEAAESKERLRLMIQMSPFPIIISRLKDDQLMLINSKAGVLFGLDVKHPGNFKTIDYFADPSARRELLAKLEKKPVVDDFEVLVKPRKGEPFWLLLSARVIDFEYEIALYMAFQDITGRKKKELKLFDQATRDPLTNCYNRRQFEELAGNEVQRSRRYGHHFCLFMIDADHFKNVNDTYGHAVGDHVLQALANCCRMTLRESDIVARFGGEEFVVLLPEVSIENAHRVAERLRIKISKLVVKSENDVDVRFTVSMGLVSSTETDNIDDMLKMADEALYVAKQNGRNKVIIYSDGRPNKDTVPPTGDDIERTSAEPLYYYKATGTVTAAAPTDESAEQTTAYDEEADAKDDDLPLEDGDAFYDEPAVEGRGVSLDDLYDSEEELSETVQNTSDFTVAEAEHFEPEEVIYEEILQEEEYLPIDSEEREVEEQRESQAMEAPLVVEDDLPLDEEMPLIDDLDPLTEESPLIDDLENDLPLDDDLSIEDDLPIIDDLEETSSLEPVRPHMPPSPPPGMKKIPMKAPPGMGLKMAKVPPPGSARVKIPRPPGAPPVPPPKKPDGE